MRYIHTSSKRRRKIRTTLASLVTALGVGSMVFYLTRIFLMRGLFPRENYKQSGLDLKEAPLE